MNTYLSLKLVEWFKVRYFKGRNTQMVPTSKFSENSRCFSPRLLMSFRCRSNFKATIIRTIKALFGRLYPEEVPANQCEVITGAQRTKPKFNRKGELAWYERTETDTFTKEFNLFVSGCDRTKILQQAYEALLVVPPTSVEAELVFSPQ